eukprot:280024-Lingulodinium_polyedra.AAC.1
MAQRVTATAAWTACCKNAPSRTRTVGLARCWWYADATCARRRAGSWTSQLARKPRSPPHPWRCSATGTTTGG